MSFKFHSLPGLLEGFSPVLTSGLLRLHKISNLPWNLFLFVFFSKCIWDNQSPNQPVVPSENQSRNPKVTVTNQKMNPSSSLTTEHHAKLWLPTFLFSLLEPWPALSFITQSYKHLPLNISKTKEFLMVCNCSLWMSLHKAKSSQIDFSNSEVKALHTISTLLNMRPSQYHYR